MRSRLLRTARCLGRDYTKPSAQALRCSGARWQSTSGREWSTPLAKTLAEAISVTGPLPVAAYMRQCLTSDLGGYYTSHNEGRDVFGQKGDFITSPEISQVFGELVGLWVVAEWMAQGRKSEGVYLMEVGPGRGTLMDDMLRTIRNFPALASSLEAVYLVEASPSLREAQHKLLCGDKPIEEIDIGHQSYSKYADNLKVIWTEDVRFVARDPAKTPFIIAHEFFDALPIHIFQSVPPSQPSAPSEITTPTGKHTLNETARLPRASQTNSWRELLVSPTPPYSNHASLGTPKSQQSSGPPPEFELTVAKASTPHSLYLPETSQRYKALKNSDHAVIEISPESQAYAADFAVRIGGGTAPTPTPSLAATSSSTTTTTTQARPVSSSKPEPVHKPTPSGAALILDYGPPSTIPTNSLRGIKQHRMVSPLSEPGLVDLSADVDFMSLAETAINASEGVEVHGPVEQALFLNAMGIKERAAQLVKRALDRERGASLEKSEGERRKEDLTETVKRIETGWKRLVDRGPQGMGKLYQVMAIVPHVPPKEGEKRRRPVGFGGDIVV